MNVCITVVNKYYYTYNILTSKMISNCSQVSRETLLTRVKGKESHEELEECRNFKSYTKKLLL